MAKTLVNDFDNKIKRMCSPREKDKIRRERKKEQKTLERIRKYDNLPTDEIEQWVDEDFELMEDGLHEESDIRDELERLTKVPVGTFSRKWYNGNQPLGRFWKPIHRSNAENDKATILISRSGDPTIYRLGVPSGSEITTLLSAIKQGYTVSKINISNLDLD
jgi:hypothetical protein